MWNGRKTKDNTGNRWLINKLFNTRSIIPESVKIRLQPTVNSLKTKKTSHFCEAFDVVPAGIEPATQGFSVLPNEALNGLHSFVNSVGNG